MKTKLYLIFIFLSAVIINGQNVNHLPAIKIDDIPGGSIKREAAFDGDALWGHINGGADIYLEYGFENLLLQEISWKGFEIRAEFYRMTSAESAFGIFSVSKYKCTMTDTITKWVCITPYQVQGAVGNYYISIANDKGTKEAQKTSTDLFNIAVKKISIENHTLPRLFETASLKQFKTSVKFFKGRLGFQNGFPEWSEMFESSGNYKVTLLDQNSDEPLFLICQIEFENKDKMEKFISMNKLVKSSLADVFTGTDGSIVQKGKIINNTTIILIKYDKSRESKYADLWKSLIN